MKEVPDRIRGWAPAAKLTWWIIEERGEASKTDLLEATGLDGKTVDHHLSSLENTGLIKKTKDNTYISSELI